jgi:hypothetical protein
VVQCFERTQDDQVERALENGDPAGTFTWHPSKPLDRVWGNLT